MPCQWLVNEHDKIVNDVLNHITEMILPPNPAMIFDIDYTLLNGSGEANTAIVWLYNTLKKRGITPILITARAEYNENIKHTIAQLKKAGVSEPAFIYFRPIKKDDIKRYKYESRYSVYNKKYNTIMSIGDEYWDIGAFGGLGFKLPRCECPNCSFVQPSNSIFSTGTNKTIIPF